MEKKGNRNRPIFLILMVYFSAEIQAGHYNYPTVRRNESVVDDYYGTKVKDPYRWLEIPDTPEVVSFIDQQNNVTEEYINKSGQLEAIKNTLTTVLDYPKYGVPHRHGDYYFLLENTGLQNQEVMYKRETFDGPNILFFDPNTLSSDGTVSISRTSFSDDGLLMAYGLSKSGSDWMTIHIKNVTTGEDFPEELTHAKFTNIEWTKDNKGFFYGRYTDGDEQKKVVAEGTSTTKNKDQKLYYHYIGKPQSEDVLAAAFPENPKWLIAGRTKVTVDNKYLIIFPHQGSSGECLVYYAKLENFHAGEKPHFLPVVEKFEANFEYVASEDSVIYFMTNKEAPNFRIVGIDLHQPNEKYWSVLVPHHKSKVIRSAKATNHNQLIVSYMENVKSILELRNLRNGTFVHEFPLEVGTISDMSTRRRYSEIFFKFVSFVTPGQTYRINLLEKPYKANKLQSSELKGIDTKQFLTKQIFYKSKDGTEVPMFIVHKKNLKFDGNNPTLLYAYGGFNVNLLPTFKSERLAFIQHFDGVLAVPNLRGGGEYGRLWHHGGRLLNKQNVFDDFAAAAHYLIQQNYTKSSRLIIRGGSNGGLLVGASVNQHPELFGVGIGQVGVMDMLRFQKFTIGYAWCTEYGCSDDGNKSHFDNLFKYSPLHNVRIPKDLKVQYPSVLLTTADHDDRVVPLHSFKFIAELQYKLGNETKQTNPLMIRVDTKAGHGAGKPTSKRIDESAEIFAFVAQAMNLTWKVEPMKIEN